MTVLISLHNKVKGEGAARFAGKLATNPEAAAGVTPSFGNDKTIVNTSNVTVTICSDFVLGQEPKLFTSHRNTQDRTDLEQQC